jgi:hypothetical protein
VTPRTTATFNGTVYAIGYSADRIYVGGAFTAAYWNGRTYGRKHLAALDAHNGALIMDWKPVADAPVKGLAIAGGSLYAVGDFTTIGGVARDGLAQLNLSTAALGPLTHSVAGALNGVAAGNGRLYVVGRLTAIDGQPRTNTAAFTLGTGHLDGGWKPTTDDVVEAIALGSGRVYLAGGFHRTNGVSSTGRLVAVKSDTGQLDMAFRPQPPAVVHAVAVGPGGVYGAIGGKGGHLYAYDLGGVTQWTVTADGDVQAAAVLGDTVYLGGHFDKVCNSDRVGDHGACLDGSVPRVKLAAAAISTGAIRSWDPQGNGIRGVYVLAASPSLGIIAAGGEFTTIGGMSQRRFAVFDA